jgi:alpha-methylacyl-CoA racemase
MRTGGVERDAGHPPLWGVRVLTLAVNLPGPAAASRLWAMGAFVIKVEPPGGDPLARMCPGYYEDLSAGQEVVRLDLKDQQDRASLDDRLRATDLLLTASRPAALGRLGLSWSELHAGFPRLCQVAIVGHPPPEDDAPGHDLTYQARFGTLSPRSRTRSRRRGSRAPQVARLSSRWAGKRGPVPLMLPQGRVRSCLL